MSKAKKKKMSLSNLDFGAGGRRDSGRKSSVFRMNINETFAKVLAAIVSLGSNVRPRFLSKNPAKEISTEPSGTTNPMALHPIVDADPSVDEVSTGTPPPSKAKEQSKSKLSKAKSGKKAKSKNKQDPAEEKQEALPTEEDMDFLSDNPRYRNRLLKEEKERRIKAGEDPEVVASDIARKKKAAKKPARSPLPDGF